MGGSKPAVNGLLHSLFQRSKRGAEKRSNRPATALDGAYSPRFQRRNPFPENRRRGCRVLAAATPMALMARVGSFAATTKSGLTATPYGGGKRESAGCGCEIERRD
jgi:hypothetical protein